MNGICENDIHRPYYIVYNAFVNNSNTAGTEKLQVLPRSLLTENEEHPAVLMLQHTMFETFLPDKTGKADIKVNALVCHNTFIR